MLQCFLGGRIRCFLFILDFTYTFPTQLLLFVNSSASSSRPRSVDCKATSRSYRVKTGRLVVPITTPFPGIHKYKPHWTNGWLRGIPEVWILHSLHSQMTQTPVARLNPCFFRQGWKYNKERGVRIFAVFRFFGGASSFLSHFSWVWLDYCIILLGASWKMAGHWADLRNQPTTPSSMPAPRSARKAWAPEWGGGRLPK